MDTFDIIDFPSNNKNFEIDQASGLRRMVKPNQFESLPLQVVKEEWVKQM